MRLQADWLEQALSVDVITAEPDRFLPYGEDARWSDRKHERVLADEIRYDTDTTIIPTRDRRRDQVTVYHYERTPPDLLGAGEQVRELAARQEVSPGRVVWLQRTAPPSVVACAEVLLLNTARTPPVAAATVDIFDDCPSAVRATFSAFARQTGAGLVQLASRWAGRELAGPVLVAVTNARVVGAIGPLQTWPDPTGRRQLLPPNLAVLPTHRRRGHGRALWRAAQRWSHTRGAVYHIFQAVPGSPAADLYHREGATTLGFICAATT